MSIPFHLAADARLLMATRFIRLFAYGALSVVLVFYLAERGLAPSQIGLLLTSTLVGDTAISLLLTTQADRFGRRRTLLIGAALMVAAGLVFSFTRSWWLLLVAGTLGVISPSGHEVGPFLPVEQAALSSVVPDHQRTEVLAWYAFTGSIATALGALAGGLAAHLGDVMLLYAGLGVVLALLFTRLSQAAESADPGTRQFSITWRAGALAPAAGAPVIGWSGLGQSYGVVLKLSALFALDSFGGGFVIQSFAAYWFYLRFGMTPASLGAVFFSANLLAGISALVASRLAARIGLIKTMVFTHLPSNVLLILVPLMPTASLAVATLLVRFSISQMDVPARQSYVMSVVGANERSAAAGVTGVARTVGAAISPVFVGLFFAQPSLINLPFFIAGSLKIVYDLLLYRAFVR